MSRQKPFTEELWYEKEDTIITIGVIDEVAASIEEIESLELPSEGDHVDIDVILGSLETDQGTIDLYSPVSGVVLEVNHLILEDPTMIIEDPSEGWLIKVESEEDPEELADDEDEVDDDEEDEDTEDEDDDYEDED